jgi:6-phosphogluconolactonase (cycloisomerase 2 family)
MSKALQRSNISSFSLALGLLASTTACGGGGGGGGSTQPPQNLSYERSFALYAKGVEGAQNAPTVSGNANTWTIVPALPAGLDFDTSTGVVSGAPAELSPASDYVVRASNSAGFAETTLRVGVVKPAFVALACNTLDNTLSSFVVDSTSGALIPTGYEPAPAGASQPRTLAAHPTANAVYVGHFDSRHISRFELEPASGRVLARENVDTQSRPEELALHPSGTKLYLFSRLAPHIETFDVNPLDGSLTSQATLSLGSNGLEAVARTADGRFMWVTNVNSTNQTITTLAVDSGTLLPAVSGASIPTTNKLRSLALSPDERFLYGASSEPAGSTIDVFTVDATTGALTKFDSVSVGAFAIALAIEPTGRFLYVSVSSEDTVRAFAIDPVSGALSVPADPAVASVPTGDRPWSLSIDPAGAHLYVSELNSLELGVYTIDPVSGALTRRESLRTRENPSLLALIEREALAVPRAPFVYVGNLGSGDVSIFATAPSTGDLTLVESGFPFGGQPGTLARHPRGAWMYAVDEANGLVRAYSTDPSSGDLVTIAGPVGTGVTPVAAQVEPSGRYLYVVNRGSNNVSSFRIDSLTGALSQLSQFATGASPSALAVDPSGRFVLVANQQAQTLSVFEIDPANGDLVAVGPATPIAGEPAALAIHPSGRFVLSAQANTGDLSLLRLEAAGGALSFVQSIASGVAPSSIATGPRGSVFVANEGGAGAGGVTHGRIDLALGSLSLVGFAAAGANPVDLVVEPSGAMLYVVNQGSNDVTPMSLDPLTGVPSVGAASLAGVAPGAIEIQARFD